MISKEEIVDKIQAACEALEVPASSSSLAVMVHPQYGHGGCDRPLSWPIARPEPDMIFASPRNAAEIDTFAKPSTVRACS